ncbi:MAG TPA: TIGR04086 family membrane protein [Firmicutes bacterium]|jgi:putative membrane protein (TIGR04086 family)|nr:TIGR04086 family membrane protein [Bacillota bacterium]
MAKKNGAEVNEFHLRPMAIVQGFLLSLVLLLLISNVQAAIVYFSSWQTNPRLLNILAHFAVFGGTVLAGCRCHKKAWLHGIIVGVMVFSLFSWVGYGGALLVTWAWWKSLLKMAFVAMLGGILGGLFVTK